MFMLKDDKPVEWCTGIIEMVIASLAKSGKTKIYIIYKQIWTCINMELKGTQLLRRIKVNNIYIVKVVYTLKKYRVKKKKKSFVVRHVFLSNYALKK